MQTRIVQALEAVLKQFGDTYYLDHRLNKAKVIEDLDHYDENLVKAMLDSPIIKKHFTKKIGDYQIIEVNKLIEVFEMNDYWLDSQTKYSKKIGLTTGGRFLDEATEVVLDFPYKDTVLKAGMSKEDVQKDDLKPDEPFYNEVIAAEEIDVMLDKKILVNAKRYTSEGAEKATFFSEEDNLILKGNNLLALHTLKEKYAGKVKLIYIDPPYNTGNDSFQYNDNFNHSTWLTFIKNRLEIAKELLSQDGSIWINVDDNEAHYLKILCDEIFNQENFISTIIWEKKFSPQNDATWFSDNHDFIILYAKDKEIWRPNLLERTEAMDSRYKNPDNDPRGPWTSSDFTARTYSATTDYPITTPSGRVVRPSQSRSWITTKEEFDRLVKDNRIWFGKDGNNIPRKKTFLSEVQDGVVPKSIWKYDDVGSTQDAKKEIKKLDFVEIFSTPKPEKLLQRVIQIGSNEKDIVLDFFMGSATTQAVAMKMNRRFIGIEQMDYINTISVPRLQKVIEGEQGGISKDVNWQGGGSFVYAELMEKSRGYIDAIYQAENALKLKEIYQLMLDSVSLDFKADLQAIEEMFDDSIALDEKKKLMIKVIDKNQLYYNFSEIDDSNVRELISESDYQFNQSFYQEDELNG